MVETTMDSPTAAAWLQAVASVLAIAAAFVVGWWQAKAALTAVTEAHAIERASRRKSILAIAEAGAEHARRIDSALSSGVTAANSAERRLAILGALLVVYDKSIVDGLVRALTNIPLHDVGSPDAVIALLAIRDRFVFLGVAMERYIDGPWNDPGIKQAIEACGPDEHAMRQRVVDDADRVLAGNARRYLAAILEHCGSLKRSINLP